MNDLSADPDMQLVRDEICAMPDTQSVAAFVPGPGIQRLSMQFDIAKLREALDECPGREAFKADRQDEGFAALPLTRRPGATEVTANDLSGRYWLRPDDRYVEEPREEMVDEAQFSEFDPRFAGTYFEEVHAGLSRRFTIGRMRVLSNVCITAIRGTATPSRGCTSPC